MAFQPPSSLDLTLQWPTLPCNRCRICWKQKPLVKQTPRLANHAEISLWASQPCTRPEAAENMWWALSCAPASPRDPGVSLPSRNHPPESEWQDAEAGQSICREVHNHFLYFPEQLSDTVWKAGTRFQHHRRAPVKGIPFHVFWSDNQAGNYWTAMTYMSKCQRWHAFSQSGVHWHAK